MTVRPPRSILVVLYAVLVGLGYVVHALPGLPHYRTDGEFAFWLAVDVVLIVFIARGSRAAIVIPLALNAFGFVAILFVSVGPPWSSAPGVLAYLVVRVAATTALVLLWRDLTASPRSSSRRLSFPPP